MPPPLKRWTLQNIPAKVLHQSLAFTCLSEYRIDNNYLSHFIESITIFIRAALSPEEDLTYMIGDLFTAAYPSLKEHQEQGVNSTIYLSVPTGWINTIKSKLDNGYMTIPISAPFLSAPLPTIFMVATDKGAALCGPSSVTYDTLNWPDFHKEAEIEKDLHLLDVKCDRTIRRMESTKMPGISVIGAWAVEGPASQDLPPHLPIHGQRVWVRMELSLVKGNLDFSGLALVRIPAIPLPPRQYVSESAPKIILSLADQVLTTNLTMAAALRRDAHGRNCCCYHLKRRTQRVPSGIFSGCRN
jgi:hypothetical protein